MISNHGSGGKSLAQPQIDSRWRIRSLLSSHATAFSYGTLQQENVQLKTFGRLLQGETDDLLGFEQEWLKIEDPEVIRTSGKTHHPILKFSGRRTSRIAGTVFTVTDEELASADRYEVAAYKRIQASLASGQRAWVYVDVATAPADTQVQ